MNTEIDYQTTCTCPICGQRFWLVGTKGVWRRGEFAVCMSCCKFRGRQAGAWLDGWDACLQSTK